MSWNFKITGKDKAVVKAEVDSNTYCPEPVRTAIKGLVDNLDLSGAPAGKEHAVYVESDGHVDSHHGYGKFSVNRAIAT